MAAGELCATVAPRTFEGAGLRLVVGDWGLEVRRPGCWPRRIWWEEVRQVEWLAHGQVRLWLSNGRLELDDSLPELRELVEVVEAAVREVRAAWRARLPGEKLARLAGLGPDRQRVLPTGARWQRAWEAAGPWLLDAALLSALYTAFCTDDWGNAPELWIRLLGPGVLAALLRLQSGGRPEALPGSRLWALGARLRDWWWRPSQSSLRPRLVALSARGWWFDGRCRPWEQVRRCELDVQPNSPSWQVTLAGGGWEETFRLARWGTLRLRRTLRVLADLTALDFVWAGEEPPPDNALSLTRLTGDHEAVRGLSVTREEGH